MTGVASRVWYPAGFIEESDLPRPAPSAWLHESLESVIATDELARRPPREPNYEAENRALVALAQHMEQSPRSILSRLVETTKELCQAGSAGISIIEPNGGAGIFRWHALAGALSAHLGGTTPRDFSPCGTVVDRNTIELMSLPERHFGYFSELKPTIVEALLVPFVHRGRTVGTIWVMTHDNERQFDAEDARVVGNLARFASAAYEVTSALQRTKDEERRKDEFLAMLAHELRGPLSALESAMEFLHLRLKGVPNRALEEMNERSRRQIKAMSRLVDDLLDVARIAHGKIELHRERVDLATVVQHAIEASRPHIDAAHHELVVAVPREPVWIDCDPVRIAQAVTNLLNNAAKYMPDHGRIEVRAVQARTEVTIRIRDQGIGIPTEALFSIFELFTQLDAARTRYRGGLGVGLSLVKRLIELHDGTVAAYSKGPGCGSEFVIRLPTGNGQRNETPERFSY